MHQVQATLKIVKGHTYFIFCVQLVHDSVTYIVLQVVAYKCQSKCQVAHKVNLDGTTRSVWT